MLKLVKTVYKDPKTDPYLTRHYDKIKDLDNDKMRHLIKPIITIITEDCKGCEHEFCDPDQLDENGKYRRPKLLIESERRGFATVMDMVLADKKAEEDKKQKELDDLKKIVSEQNKLLEMMMAKIN